ncbi:MAG: DsbA family protein [Bacteroidota bacterium]
MIKPEAAYCDPTTGLCTPSPIEGSDEPISYREDVEIIYVGDPMCSWCWGISPALNQLQNAAEVNSIPYRLVMGGLRPGGGDPWNEEFRSFLKHHWEEVNARSGQPFGMELFKRESFNYDTEPACRSVVAARQLVPESESRFFELVQHRFYVLNEDPNKLGFYEPICEDLNIDFDQFSVLFESEATKAATLRDFQISRQMGISGFPTVVFRKEDQFIAIARGYSEFDSMWSAVTSLMEGEN